MHRNMGLNNELMRDAGTLAGAVQSREEAVAQPAHATAKGSRVPLSDEEVEELCLWHLSLASPAKDKAIRRCTSFTSVSSTCWLAAPKPE